MSFGWHLLINWIIGIIIMLVAISLLMWISRKKFGEDTLIEAFGNEDFDWNNPEDVKALCIAIISSMLWMIVVPIVIYGIYNKIKETHKNMNSNKP